MSATSTTVDGDQYRSATAAMRGQMRESTVSGVTHSAHMHASPPMIRAFASVDRFAISLPSGSTA